MKQDMKRVKATEKPVLTMWESVALGIVALLQIGLTVHIAIQANRFYQNDERWAAGWLIVLAAISGLTALCNAFILLKKPNSFVLKMCCVFFVAIAIATAFIAMGLWVYWCHSMVYVETFGATLLAVCIPSAVLDILVGCYIIKYLLKRTPCKDLDTDFHV